MPSNTARRSADVVGRRERKRELDRRAQRAARERTKSHIAYLEATIEALKEQHSDNGTSKLITQLAEVMKQRDDLANTMASIRSLIDAIPSVSDVAASGSKKALLGDAPASPAKTPSPPSTCHLDTPLDIDSVVDLITSAETPAPETVGRLHLHTDELMSDHLADQLLPNSSALASFIESSASILGASDADAPCDCIRYDNVFGSSPTRALQPLAGQSIWTVAKGLLGRNNMLCKQTLSLEDELKEDIPIRVALEGWGSVDTGNLPPLWNTLRQIDELQFQHCNATERLAILTIMHRILRERAETTIEQHRHSQLPLWLWARPSQSLPHPAAIDFFVWPGLRERFVFSQHRYCSDLFWKVFAENFRIRWPYETRDCYNKNVVTGKYCISPEFEKCLWDIDSWSMCGEFFHFFPELSVDIPVFI